MYILPPLVHNKTPKVQDPAHLSRSDYTAHVLVDRHRLMAPVHKYFLDKTALIANNRAHGCSIVGRIAKDVTTKQQKIRANGLYPFRLIPFRLTKVQVSHFV